MCWSIERSNKVEQICFHTTQKHHTVAGSHETSSHLSSTSNLHSSKASTVSGEARPAVPFNGKPEFVSSSAAGGEQDKVETDMQGVQYTCLI